MRSMELCAVHVNNRIRKINAVKHGACLETSFQPSIYCLYQLFHPLVAITPMW